MFGVIFGNRVGGLDGLVGEGTFQSKMFLLLDGCRIDDTVLAGKMLFSILEVRVSHAEVYLGILLILTDAASCFSRLHQVKVLEYKGQLLPSLLIFTATIQHCQLVGL